MTIQDLGSIGEFVAAIATIATLAYLALQIRQNTKTARTAAIQASVDNSASWNEMLARDAQLSELFWRGMADPESLELVERRRFMSALTMFMRRESLSYYLYTEGDMPEALWSPRVRVLSGLFNQPGMHVWLEVFGDTLPEEFRAFLTETMSSRSTLAETAQEVLGGQPERGAAEPPIRWTARRE